MLSNILKLLGGISVAFIIGYIVGVRQVTNNNVPVTNQTVTENRETEKSTTTITEVTKPDGTREVKTVTDVTKVTDKKKDKAVPAARKDPPKKARFGIQARPEWEPERDRLKLHPAVTVGYRIYDSPLWADLHLDIDRKEVAIGISVEW